MYEKFLMKKKAESLILEEHTAEFEGQTKRVKTVSI
jgi:hypothetical protein